MSSGKGVWSPTSQISKSFLHRQILGSENISLLSIPPDVFSERERKGTQFRKYSSSLLNPWSNRELEQEVN